MCWDFVNINNLGCIGILERMKWDILVFKKLSDHTLILLFTLFCKTDNFFLKKVHLNDHKENKVATWWVQKLVYKMFIMMCLLISFFFCLHSDLNECALITNNCHADSTCTNQNGSFDCNCNIGYSGNGTFCEGKHLRWFFCLN